MGDGLPASFWCLAPSGLMRADAKPPCTRSIPALKASRRDELEELLSIFDQSNRTKDMHIMNIGVEDYPKRLQPVLQRLQKAAKNLEVQVVMGVDQELITLKGHE
jgi:hypothetical protein